MPHRQQHVARRTLCVVATKIGPVTLIEDGEEYLAISDETGEIIYRAETLMELTDYILEKCLDGL